LSRVCTRLRKETQAKGNSSFERWHQLAKGAIRHLDDLNTIETEIAEFLKPTKRRKEKAKSYKKIVKKLIAIFGDCRDS
jgi:hypothetical protein